tara:strand:- start:31 stop:1515 length:1485 start_codon:yes stop_codon:yes gene_type:complete
MNKSIDREICIIGGGMGSISAAIYLRSKGYKVSIYEKNSTLGGRANIIEEKGFRFDVGPSLLNYPWIFENLFDAAGEKMEDHIDLIEIKSGVKFLWDDKETFTITSDFPLLSKEIARLEKSHINGLSSFLKINSKRYNIAFEKLLNKNLDNPLSWGIGLGFNELLSGSMFKSMYSDLGKHFKSDYIKQAFGSYAMYLGGSPFKIPGFFSILPYGEIAYGLWMPRGGIYSLIEKLENILEKKGVKIFKNSQVSEIITNKNEVRGIVLEDGRSIPYEIVISNVDLPTTESRLIKNNNNDSFNNKQMTPSVMTFYWGLNKETDFPHHMIFLPDDYKGCFDDLFTKKIFPNGMPFYTSSPSVSDKSLSPNGKSTLFVLIPLPVTEKDNEVNIHSNEIEKIKTLIFDRFNHHNIDLTQDNIEYEKIYTPDEWKNLFGLYKTSAFGASHNLFNIGPFRNKNKSNYKGLYYVGASTTPGTGLPMVTLSGKLVSDRIENDLS